jgi:hypothetical protein
VESATTKKPVTDRLSREPGNSPQSVLQCADVLAEPALVPRSLVLVDQAFAGGLVDNRHGFLESGLRRFCVTSGDCFEYVLDVSAQHRALAGKALAAIFRLTGAFAGLCRVCQGFSPAPGSKEPATMRISPVFVNENTCSERVS